MTIAVDFDGTIVHHRYPAIGKPVPFALEVLKQLSADGHKLILFTVREGKLLEDAVEYCRQNGLEFYAVNSEYPDAAWSGSGVSRKLRADMYIDDRNFGGLPEWTEIYETISGMSFNGSGAGVGSGFGSGSGSGYKPAKKEGFFKRIRRRTREARRRLER